MQWFSGRLLFFLIDGREFKPHGLKPKGKMMKAKDGKWKAKA
jgi:hypothetical protein